MTTQVVGRRVRNWRRRASLVALAVLGVLPVLTPPSLAGAQAPDPRRLLTEGKWEAAETLFRATQFQDPGGAALGLAELYRITGRYSEALAGANDASRVAGRTAAGLCLAGEVLRETGRLSDAVDRFRAATRVDPASAEAFARLGRALQELGQKVAAEQSFKSVLDLARRAGPKPPASTLHWAGVAARGVRAWQEATQFFEQALESDPQLQEVNLDLGELFQAKYNAEEAGKCFQQVLKQNPKLPRALVGMGALQVSAGNDHVKATALADEALKSNPRCVPALALKAQLALDDDQFPAAEKLLQQALAINGQDLESLALMAASRWLQDDLDAYQTYKQRVLQFNPRASGFFVLIGELAIRAHRYVEAAGLAREALTADPEDPVALEMLGTNLMREGLAREPEALGHIRRSFQGDPFNVRTFNTLNLYEEVIAKEYQSVTGTPFAYRFNKKEQPILSLFVPQLMDRAWDGYRKKYGFTPTVPITVELFTERQHYGARTIGLPELGAQGTCFGQLITAMSPSAGEASWEQVLWHELAHVFHLQLSRNRVSRWFTEGLAEYETNVERPYWKREYAREIFDSLREGSLWKISELSAAFTRPSRPNGVVIAYQQSSLVIHYLVESFGFEKIVQALKLYGQGKLDAEVLRTVTGKELDELDRGFAAYLVRRYPYYQQGFSAFTPDLAKAAASAQEKPSDPEVQANYALALVPTDPKAAVSQARKVLELDPRQPRARFALAQALLKQGDAAAAQAEFGKLLEAGVDGYPIRMSLGRALAQGGDLAGAEREWNSAKKWDPDQEEPYQLLIQLYEARERREDLLRETEASLDVDEHDHAAARLLVDRYSLDGRWADLVRVYPRVVAISPTEPYVHQAYGLALAQLKRPADAAKAYEAALLAGPRRPALVRGRMARQLLLAGDKERARKAAREALKEEPRNADARAVLESLGETVP